MAGEVLVEMQNFNWLFDFGALISFYEDLAELICVEDTSFCELLEARIFEGVGEVS